MTFRHPDPPRPPASPRPLLVALAALLASEIFHIAATLQNHSEPQAPHPFGPAAHVASAVLTAALMVWVGRRGPLAAPLTALAGGSVAVAAIAYHVIPTQLAFNNPFAHGATGLQWLSVFVGIAAGISCVVVGLRATRWPVTDGEPAPGVRAKDFS